jgi:hypothetical protein
MNTAAQTTEALLDTTITALVALGWTEKEASRHVRNGAEMHGVSHIEWLAGDLTRNPAVYDHRVAASNTDAQTVAPVVVDADVITVSISTDDDEEVDVDVKPRFGRFGLEDVTCVVSNERYEELCALCGGEMHLRSRLDSAVQDWANGSSDDEYDDGRDFDIGFDPYMGQYTDDC